MMDLRFFARVLRGGVSSMRVRQEKNGSSVLKTPTYAGEMLLYPGCFFSAPHYYDGVLFCFPLAMVKMIAGFFLGPAGDRILT